MKEVENNKPIAKREGTENTSDFIAISNSNFIPSNNIDYLIKKLSNPGFLGSIHLKKEMNPNYQQIDNMLATEHESKLTQSLKNTIFNPITKKLIISAIIFNIIWILLTYLV